MTKVFSKNEECFFRIGESVPNNKVNIAYYKTPEINPEDNTVIINQEVRMNRHVNEVSDLRCAAGLDQALLTHEEKKEVFHSTSFALTDKLITDEELEIFDKPVYYKHKLRYHHLDSSDSDIRHNIVIVNSKGEQISDDNFLYLDINKLEGQVNNRDRFEITIYTDFLPAEDETYTVDYHPEKSELYGNYKEILNPQPIFERTDTDNFTSLQENDTDQKYYFLEMLEEGFNILVPFNSTEYGNNEKIVELASEYLEDNEELDDLTEEEKEELHADLEEELKKEDDYNITYSEDGNYYKSREYWIKFNDSSEKIYSEVNKHLTKDKSWPLKVHQDSFTDTTNSIESSQKAKELIYGIPEFYYQDLLWHEGSPYMHIEQEEVDIIGDHTIQLQYNNMYIETIENEDGYIVPDNEGEGRLNLETESGQTLTVINWDLNTGKLKTLDEIPSESIKATYDYITDFYKYEGYYDGNNNFISIDFNPTVGHFYNYKNTANELYDGQTTVETYPSMELCSKKINIYLRPEYVIEEDGSVHKNRTTLFHTINHDIHDDPSHPLVNKDIERKLYTENDIKLISTIFVIPVTNPEEITIIDSRSRGGGVKDSVKEEIKELYDEANKYWDIGKWNGEFYPSNGVAVIELPEEVLDTFSHEQIEEKIKKHLALGVLPVIRYI